jgi:hypothetical protein
MMFAGSSREALRQRYVTAWQRRREGLPLEPLDAQIADVIDMHPEYQQLLQDAEALEAAYTVEEGRINPFLHMGLHLGLREQLATRRPAGIEQIHAQLAARLGDAHEAEHRMWEAQRAGRAPDEAAYLDRLRRL